MSRILAGALACMVLCVACGQVAQAQVGKSQGVLEINTASAEDLAKAPHFTADLAKAVVEKRPFASMDDVNKFLTEQKLSKEQLTEVYGKLFLHLNLNTASKEEIMLIPGMSNRMVHEFEEYRPYKSMEQFHREIGKYVDEKETARFAQYVFAPINLNTASDDDIMSIPGLSRRMLREFKEYRPYKNIEQFRKEIGKYVDEKEVARLERFVTLD